MINIAEANALLTVFIDKSSPINEQHIEKYLEFLQGDNTDPIESLSMYIDAAKIRENEISQYITKHFDTKKTLIKNALRRKDSKESSLLMYLCESNLDQILYACIGITENYPNDWSLSDCLWLDKNAQGTYLANQFAQRLIETEYYDRRFMIVAIQKNIETILNAQSQPSSGTEAECTAIIKSMGKCIAHINLTAKLKREPANVSNEDIKNWLENLSFFEISEESLFRIAETFSEKIATFIKETYPQNKTIILNAFARKIYSGFDLIGQMIFRNKCVEIVDSIFETIKNNADDWSADEYQFPTLSNESVTIGMLLINLFESKINFSSEADLAISTRITQMQTAMSALRNIESLEASKKIVADNLIESCRAILTAISELKKAAPLLKKFSSLTEKITDQDIIDYFNLLKIKPVPLYALKIITLRKHTPELNEFLANKYAENKQLIKDIISTPNGCGQNMLMRLLNAGTLESFNFVATILSTIENNPSDWSLNDTVFNQRTVVGYVFLDYLEARNNHNSNEITLAQLNLVTTHFRNCVNALLQYAKAHNTTDQEGIAAIALPLITKCDRLLDNIKAKQMHNASNKTSAAPIQNITTKTVDDSPAHSTQSTEYDLLDTLLELIRSPQFNDNDKERMDQILTDNPWIVQQHGDELYAELNDIEHNEIDKCHFLIELFERHHVKAGSKAIANQYEKILNLVYGRESFWGMISQKDYIVTASALLNLYEKIDHLTPKPVMPSGSINARKEGDTPFIVIIKSNETPKQKIDKFKEALDKSHAGLFDRDANKWTCLMHAVKLQDESIFSFLLERLKLVFSSQPLNTHALPFNNIDDYLDATAKDGTTSAHSLMDDTHIDVKNLKILCELQKSEIRQLRRTVSMLIQRPSNNLSQPTTGTQQNFIVNPSNPLTVQKENNTDKIYPQGPT